MHKTQHILLIKVNYRKWANAQRDGVPQTTGPISAASGSKFSILWGHVEEILLLSDCRYVP